MDFLLQGYTALKGDTGKTQSGYETVLKLCERVMHSSLLEDRRIFENQPTVDVLYKRKL